MPSLSSYSFFFFFFLFFFAVVAVVIGDVIGGNPIKSKIEKHYSHFATVNVLKKLLKTELECWGVGLVSEVKLIQLFSEVSTCKCKG